jgi:hypothetical protein
MLRGLKSENGTIDCLLCPPVRITISAARAIRSGFGGRSTEIFNAQMKQGKPFLSI